MKRPSLIILILVMLFCSGGLQGLHFARWNTSMGDFTAEIYEQLVPITGNNFIDLANSGFYNDLIFHRVVDGFVIQDGAPTGRAGRPSKARSTGRLHHQRGNQGRNPEQEMHPVLEL